MNIRIFKDKSKPETVHPNSHKSDAELAWEFVAKASVIYPLPGPLTRPRSRRRN